MYFPTPNLQCKGASTVHRHDQGQCTIHCNETLPGDSGSRGYLYQCLCCHSSSSSSFPIHLQQC